MKDRKKKRKAAAILGSILFLAAFAALYTYLYAIPKVSESLKQTAIVEYGTRQSTDEARCLIIRDETVYYAEDSGNISYYAKENEKTRRFSKIVDIYPAGSSGKGYFCKSTGFISYYLDGYEDILTKGAIKGLDPVELAQADIKPEDCRKDAVSSGDAMFKQINTDTWYMVLTVDNEKLSLYTTGSSISVEFEDGSIKGSITEIHQHENQSLVVISTHRYYENFANIRQVNVKLILQDYSGLVVPNTAIAEEDGQKGVYVQNINGEFNFKAVEIQVEGDEDTLITEGQNVNIYDEILRNAQSRGE